MNNCQRVPSWDLDENPIIPRTLDYEVAELTWENGQPAMHGLGLPKVPSGLLKGPPTHVSTKYNNSGSGSSGGGGTLESIVNQATTTPPRKIIGSGGGNDLLSWFVPSTSGEAMTMDALVPCTNNTNNINPTLHILDARVRGTSTRVDWCSGARNVKLPRVTASDLASHDWNSRVSNSGTCGKEYSPQLTLDTCTAGFTSTSMGSQDNTSSGMQHTYKTGDDDHDDSVCHGTTHQSERGEGSKMKGTGKGSVSTKRSRAAAIHNHSERKRRDKINQRMKTLQKMIPNSSKTDKASMLAEVIEYLKQLQAQIHMVSRMNMPQMMLPLAMQQQQLQMSMMGSPMGMGLPGLGMGMGLMEMNTMGHNNINGMPPVLHPHAYMQTAVAPWDGMGDRMPSSATPTIHDPLTAFLASQYQPMTMDAYTRMATLFQQFYQQSGAFNNKN